MPERPPARLDVAAYPRPSLRAERAAGVGRGLRVVESTARGRLPGVPLDETAARGRLPEALALVADAVFFHGARADVTNELTERLVVMFDGTSGSGTFHLRGLVVS